MKKFAKRYIILFLSLFFFLSIQANAKTLSLDEKVSQMIIVGFNGSSVNSFGFKKILKQVKNNEISGVIFFQKNIKSKDKLTKMTQKLLNASEIPPFIAIDNEGGQIQRHNLFKSKSAKEVSFLSYSEAQKEYSNMAKSLKELGFNLNFAPCVDLDINKNSIISKKERSYGIDPEIVSKYASIFIEEHNKNKIITSIKHFPGHGSIEKDTHKTFADATKVFNVDELEPYYLLKNYDEMNMVMISHIFNFELDEKYPASLSSNTIRNFLINEIGFLGVIISDDYDMKAIKDNFSLEEIVIKAINSGVNILLFSNNIDGFDRNITKKIKKIVKNEIEKGNINLDDIDNSYLKIMNLKRNLN